MYILLYYIASQPFLQVGRGPMDWLLVTKIHHMDMIVLALFIVYIHNANMWSVIVLIKAFMKFLTDVTLGHLVVQESVEDQKGLVIATRDTINYIICGVLGCV